MRRRWSGPFGRVVVVTGVTIVVLACTPASGSRRSADPAPTETATTTAAATIDAAPASAAPDATQVSTPGSGPPEADLTAEGGDAVRGQLGSYAWQDSGSDGPWLPGAPMTVGAGEPLSVRLQPAHDVASWRARFVPAGATGPTGAVVLGEGTGDAAFIAPPAGRWTVELAVIFAGGIGSASYAWLLEVT